MRLRGDEDGFTLVELVVATAVLSVILLAIGGLLFGTTITQRSVSAVSQSTSSAQTAADAIRTQVRNASEFRLFPVGAADQLLVARVAGTGSTATYTCVGWYYAAVEHELRTRSWGVNGSTAIPTSSAVASTWALLLDGVSPRSGSAVFQPPSGGTIEVAYEVETDDRNEPTALQFTAALAGQQGGGSTCWD